MRKIHLDDSCLNHLTNIPVGFTRKSSYVHNSEKSHTKNIMYFADGVRTHLTQLVSLRHWFWLPLPHPLYYHEVYAPDDHEAKREIVCVFSGHGSTFRDTAAQRAEHRECRWFSTVRHCSVRLPGRRRWRDIVWPWRRDHESGVHRRGMVEGHLPWRPWIVPGQLRWAARCINVELRDG